MGILTWIVFGLVVGIIAKLLMPGRDPGGFIVTILLGIAGALLGGFIGRAMGFYGPQESAGWLMSIGRFPRPDGTSRGRSRRTSDSKSPLSPVRNLQWW